MLYIIMKCEGLDLDMSLHLMILSNGCSLWLFNIHGPGIQTSTWESKTGKILRHVQGIPNLTPQQPTVDRFHHHLHRCYHDFPGRLDRKFSVSNPIPFGAHRISPRRPSTVRKSTSRPSDKLQHASSQVGAGYRQGLLLVAGVLNLLYVGTVW